ncbi:unnamed protein product [Blepharisma stoltei]|uniref:Ankyrin repeat protein n=1 Tax=Blepharisma stoltei TaxID=1481888 RepID=A0AAU9IQ11_9CILI|nr:unnamed protein product [Blepharisma stoltei]
MDEIIEKLRRPEPKIPPPSVEPMTARISRGDQAAEKPITPPPLDYFSPHLSTRFNSTIPEWIHPAHDCAASLEADAFGKLRARAQMSQNSLENPLVQDDFNGLKQAYDYARTATPENSWEYTLSKQSKLELYEAITLHKNPTRLREILKRKLPLNQPLNNDDGFCALHYAAEEGNLEIVEILLKNRASPNTQSYRGLTPIIIAASKGNISCLEAMIIYEGNLQAKDTWYRRNCLHWAVVMDQLETVRYLVERYKMAIGEPDIEGKDAKDLADSYYRRDIRIYLENHIKQKADLLL